MQAKEVKRFIAGAVCPRCGTMDRLRTWRDEVREYRECVLCGYEDQMRLDGAPEPTELPTRVNQSVLIKAPEKDQVKGAVEQRVKEAVEEQVLHFVPNPDSVPDSSKKELMVTRCGWAEVSDADRCYHDEEWGVPLYDDQRLFELLILEGAQAGLSWTTIINKRDGYRQLYQGFDPNFVAAFDQAKIDSLLENPAIVRNRLKVESSVSNARLFLNIQQQYGSFSNYIWQFVDGVPRHNDWQNMDDVPSSTPESEQMSKALKKVGFRFVGPTICYAFMQATGMVNDHLTGCFRHGQVVKLSGGGLGGGEASGNDQEG